MAKTKLTPTRSSGTPYTPAIRLRSIDGHIARTAETATAWYRLAPQRWSFRGDGERTALMQAVAGQYAELAGRWLHIRVTNRPYPIAEWARAHHRNVKSPLPDAPAALSYEDYLMGEQRQLGRASMVDKEVDVGVEITRRSLLTRAVDAAGPLLRRVWPSAAEAEWAALEEEITTLDGILAAPGLEGRPVTAEEMSWLLARSAALGLPAPQHPPVSPSGQWDSGDLAAFTDGAIAFADAPYAPTVTVRGRSGVWAGIERHVAVLSLGLMHGLDIPEHDPPWMHQADVAAAEWSARMFIRPNQPVQGELARQRTKIKSQLEHYVSEHNMDPPQQLARQNQRVSDIDDELEQGWTPLSTRVMGCWRVAVSGPTRAEALRAARALHEVYKPKISIEHPPAQYALYREFIPGEPAASRSHTRRGSVAWAAAAMPTATASIGDRQGVLVGTTAGASRVPVAWDPWRAQEIRTGSGLSAVVGSLGSGKSFLVGGLVYKTLRAGATWTVLDPSGPLAALCHLPELRPYAREINLLHAEPGILNPYRVVPEPDPGDVPDPDAYGREQSDAAATRRALVLDVLNGVLPYEIAKMPETRIVLLEAIRTVGGAPDRHPGLVIDQLAADSQRTSEHAAQARIVHNFLDEMRDRLALLIPTSPQADPYTASQEYRLTVLTMPGLTLPKDGVDRADWTATEALGVELLNLAAWLTQRMVYSAPPGYARRHGYPWKDERKGVWIDEAFFLSQVANGRVLMNRFSRDSRKWNVRVMLSSQVPADFLRMDGFRSLVDSVFVGRLSDEDTQSDALRLLHIPTGAGYEATLSQLSSAAPATEEGADRSPRQFLLNDGAGGIERVYVDFSGQHLSHVRAALETTPGQSTHPPDIQTPGPDQPAAPEAHASTGTDTGTGTHPGTHPGTDAGTDPSAGGSGRLRPVDAA